MVSDRYHSTSYSFTDCVQNKQVQNKQVKVA